MIFRKNKIFLIIALLSILLLSCNKDEKKNLESSSNVQFVDNEVDGWYLDQMDTGIYNAVNCGPTSTVMAAKWANKCFSLTPVDARAKYHPTGGWWYTNDIVNYLSDKDVPHGVVELGNSISNTSKKLIKELKAGRIIILCVDMYYIRFESNPDFRVDKFYETKTDKWGHFFIVKGYKIVNEEILFEVYDPNSWGSKYADGTYKGKDRFYRGDDIFKATNIWWNYAILVSKKTFVSSAQKTEARDTHYLDINGLPNQWGK